MYKTLALLSFLHLPNTNQALYVKCVHYWYLFNIKKNIFFNLKTELRKRDRQTDRKTDRQTDRHTDRQTDKERATCVHARNINLFVKVVFFFRLSSFKLQSSIDLLSHVYRNFLTIYYHTCTLFKVDKTRNHQKIQN